MWDAATGKPLAPALQHDKIVPSATFSPDGTRVVTACDDGTAQVWDAATGKPLAPALQHDKIVPPASRSLPRFSISPAWRAPRSAPTAAAWSTASSDHSAQVWDAFSGTPLTPGLVHPTAVRSAAFSPDGTRVVTVSFDNTVRIWSTQLDETPPEGWSTLAARSSFVLSGGVHVLRGYFAGDPGSP